MSADAIHMGPTHNTCVHLQYLERSMSTPSKPPYCRIVFAVVLSLIGVTFIVFAVLFFVEVTEDTVCSLSGPTGDTDDDCAASIQADTIWPAHIRRIIAHTRRISYTARVSHRRHGRLGGLLSDIRSVKCRRISES